MTQVLRHLIPFADPAVLVDAATADDAAVYRLDDDRALVATVDFFTPMVDNAFDFGRIAATNALSDVYAMGGRPLFALNLVGFPRAMLGDGILPDIVRGAGEVARAAGIPIVGGHSVDDPEPKFGMCVIGEVHPDRIVRNSTARVGDAIVLTKAIGTGVIATAIKKGVASDDVIASAVRSMTALNRDASAVMVNAGASAATDVTGFGLLGHLCSMMRQSHTGAVIDATAVPLLPGTLALIGEGHVPGGTARSRADVGDAVTFDGDVSHDMQTALFDAQTSGGLLMCVAPESVSDVMAGLQAAGCIVAAVIGEVRGGPAGTVVVR